MLKMPTTTGFMVEWETGKMWGKNKDRPIKEDFYTTSEKKALEVKEMKEKEGFKNVNIYECIF